MRQSRVLEKLRRNEPALVTTLHLSDGCVFELASLMGFDGIWLDLEHHAHSLETAQVLMRAARVGKSDVIARPAKNEFMRLGRLLEAGAQGIMYPRCDNAAEAAEVVKWAKFPPLGKRGCDAGGPDMPYSSMPVQDYLLQANEQTFLIIQIEEESALDQVEQIASVPGVDILFLGPGDFSNLGGYAGDMDHPRLHEASQRIAAAAKRAGIHWGRPVWSAEHAEQYLEMGARILTNGADLMFVRKGLETLQQSFQSIGFTFENQLAPLRHPKKAAMNGAPHIRIATAEAKPAAAS